MDRRCSIFARRNAGKPGHVGRLADFSPGCARRRGGVTVATHEAQEALMSLTVRFWGVRGSVPAPGPHTADVGGNTSCVELRFGDQIIVLDAGTGLRGLGERLVAAGRPVSLSMLFSHVHWDHIQGFPFFPALFRSSTELSLYG